MDDCMVMALFRHGVTKENKKGLYIGWSDAPLCQDWKDQMRNAPFHLSHYDSIYSSDLSRCKETAHLYFSNRQVSYNPDLRELHFGEWEAKHHNELAENSYYQEWLNYPFKMKTPDGETFGVFTKRVDRAIKQIKENLSRNQHNSCAIVTHSGVIRYLLDRFVPESKGFWSWDVPYGTGFELIWTYDEWGCGDRCTLLREVPLTENQHG
ncbi:histidine phosphatase family protein [Falsibacillus albus]|uniref:Histidine phosphatase family protein n=1 Tax=Falsibacillus albus TaxID=2478915 RepID=A0A3L7K1I4_9BACI|nr:histidine phosphatase family protein [Falsibacillus albus]RLQ96214.1 hypothetical protein D9X91_07955 [Falsibacillus albus]